MIANILHAYPSPIALGDGSKLTFSEHGHVAYQIKGNHNCNNLVANHKPSGPTPPPPPDPGGQKVKIQLLQNMVMLHNKLKGMEHRAPCKHIFSPYTHPQHVGWIKR